MYHRVNLPEAVNGAGIFTRVPWWRRFDPWHRGVLLVGGAIARLLVLVLPHRLAGVLRQRRRIHQHARDADGARPVVLQVRRAPGLIWNVS